MENESTSDDEDYKRVIFKYREEREEEEAEFEKHLEIALALSLSSDPGAVAIDQTDSSQQPKHSRRNRQFVSDATAHAVTQRSESNTMSFEEDESKYHPSGRRRSVELAEEMRRQMLEEEETQPHASGRRRSIEMAEEMRREMLNDSRTHHPSGRRRSVELAEDMRQQMLADQNGAAGYHPSGRRRSIEMAEDARQQMLRQTDSRTNDEEDVSRELEEMMRKGLIPPDHTQHSRPYNDNELFGYGGLSPQDPRVVGASDGQPRVPQRHRIDFKNPFQFGDDGFPVNWERSRIPDFGSEYLFNLVELVEGEDEYETIARDFHIADLDVRKIERLQNPHLLERYKGEMTQLIRRRGRDFDVNARYLYHGSASEKLILCEEGLDARLGMSGCFGKGIYFSDNPKKCIQYVSRSDVPYILMCRVMLGDAKIYQQGDMDRNLKREPEKENPTVGNKYYDSVRGRPVDFNEFVVYENRRAMIEYIITFQKRGTPLEDFSSSSKVGGAVAANAIEEESIEDHMARIQQVREEIRQTRAAERGEVYSGPTPINANPFKNQNQGDSVSQGGWINCTGNYMLNPRIIPSSLKADPNKKDSQSVPCKDEVDQQSNHMNEQFYTEGQGHPDKNFVSEGQGQHNDDIHEDYSFGQKEEMDPEGQGQTPDDEGQSQNWGYDEEEYSTDEGQSWCDEDQNETSDYEAPGQTWDYDDADVNYDEDQSVTSEGHEAQGLTSECKYHGQPWDLEYQSQAWDSEYQGQQWDPEYQGQPWNPEYQCHPECEGQTWNPQYQGQTPDPEYQGRLWNPEYQGQTWDSEYQGQQWDPEYHCHQGEPECQGQTWGPQYQGQTWNPEYQGQLWNPEYQGQTSNSKSQGHITDYMDKWQKGVYDNGNESLTSASQDNIHFKDNPPFGIAKGQTYSDSNYQEKITQASSSFRSQNSIFSVSQRDKSPQPENPPVPKKEMAEHNKPEKAYILPRKILMIHVHKNARGSYSRGRGFFRGRYFGHGRGSQSQGRGISSRHPQNTGHGRGAPLGLGMSHNHHNLQRGSVHNSQAQRKEMTQNDSDQSREIRQNILSHPKGANYASGQNRGTFHNNPRQARGGYNSISGRVRPPFLNNQSPARGLSPNSSRHGRGSSQNNPSQRSGDQQDRGIIHKTESKGTSQISFSGSGTHHNIPQGQGRGANQNNPNGRGANQTNPSGRGANQNNPSGRGANQNNPSGRGANQNNPRGRGSNQTNPRGRGSNQNNPHGRGATQNNPRGRGANQNNPSGRGANPTNRGQGRGLNQKSSHGRGANQNNHGQQRGAAQSNHRSGSSQSHQSKGQGNKGSHKR